MSRALAFVLALALTAPRLGAEETPLQNVLVRPGDTIFSIADAYLKDPSKWDVILKYNKLPTSDPTVALPGMTLKVPVRLIKERLRAAYLVYMVNRVVYRRKETVDWKAASQGMELFRGDSLRTMDAARAKVKFLNADLLSLDPNSMAVLKPVDRDYDVELKKGELFVGRSRVVTASARITPRTKDTQYSAKVREDLSTLVEVYTGLAAVEAQGATVEVKAGMQSEVKLGLAPAPPTEIADLPSFEARAAEFNGSVVQGQARVKLAAGAQLPIGADADAVNKAIDAANIKDDVASLSVGVPISAYRLQASRTRDFEKVIFNKVFEAEDRVDLRRELSPGVYWWRVALIDLLGSEQKFSAPRLYSIGLGRREGASVDLKAALTVVKPAADESVSSPDYRVSGSVHRDNLAVAVNGKAARIDENGAFSEEIRLKSGVNDISVTVSDAFGNSTTVSRRVTYGR